ncbi:hypothetical protein WHR41_08875 [Cladosporium halotolerans]|uniref:Uncharacterized protein n=1 Tax=Cladosporium halotolerans TaxID=1052096 RepID=A0AB34KED5_9PEZI
MPPRKEPKETVTYPPSKRKPPPFKPQRPSQVPRVASTSTDTTSRPASRTPSANIPATGRTSVPAAKKSGSDFASARTGIAAGTSNAGAKRKARVIDSDEDEDGIEDESSRRTDNTNKEAADDSEEDLADDPLTARPRQPPQPTAPAKRRPGRPPNRKEPSPLSISEDEMDTYMGSVNDIVAPRVPSQSGDVPSIPRPLLLRLLHENFASKDTKIDKHALAVLEKYFEIYIRETIARSSLAKKEDVENGVASQSEERWLEKSDLEKVVAGIVMDF